MRTVRFGRRRPTDSLTSLDATGTPAPMAVDDQTLRMVITPHLGGEQLRLHLTNPR